MLHLCLVNLDERQACSPHHTRYPTYLRLLTVPAICSPWSENLESISDVAATVDEEAKTIFLLRLPLELLERLFDYLELPANVVAFASAHPLIFAAGYRRINRISQELAPWAGQRVVFAQGGEDPRDRHRRVPDFLAKDPRFKLEEIKADCNAVQYFFDSCTLLARSTLDNRILKLKSFSQLVEMNAEFDWKRWGGVGCWHYPKSERWVLCNISRGVFVGLDELSPPRPHTIYCAPYPVDSFALFVRFSALVRVDHQFEGPWAGDRVKIVLRSTLLADDVMWVEKTWEQLRLECLQLMSQSAKQSSAKMSIWPCSR